MPQFHRFRAALRSTVVRTLGGVVARPELDTEIRPVSEFGANAAELIDHVRSSRRPLVLTHRGRSAAVVLDVSEYEQMLDTIDLLRDVRTALNELEAGKGVPNGDAQTQLRSRFS
jgi:antitoxin YefM